MARFSASLALVVILAASACDTGAVNVVAGDQGPDLSPETVGFADFGPADAPPETSPGEVVLEVWPEAVPDFTPACEPGTGCFGDPCAANSDCLSGFCVQHRGATVCSVTCSEECPPGWACKELQGLGPDAFTYVCVSASASLCKPCGAAADCKSPEGQDDVCVAYGSEGSFCGSTCAPGSAGDCPEGFSCKSVQSTDGVTLDQCVADTGTCPCTDMSVALGLWTPCQAANDVGTCTGKRVCTAQGLTQCDAAMPAAEACNGVDDDCDGQTDEPTLVEGKYIELCDDSNPCTADSCKGAGGCLAEKLQEGECADGNACTMGDHCEDGACVGTPIACDDGNPCTDDACDGKGGCAAEFNNADCEDGDPCTVGDECSQGACTSGTLISCQDNNPCTQDACTFDGGCLFAPAAGPCDDANACTLGDHCEEGACTFESSLGCNDDNPCTDDSCDPQAGCINTPNDAPCDDASLCTTGDHCHLGACIGSGSLLCTDNNTCTNDSCDPLVGCEFTPNADPCDDGNKCTTGDVCTAGWCTASGVLSCADGNPCTDDTCSPAAGCVFLPNSAACDDGSACTTGDTCVAGACQPSSLLTCNDGNPCTDDTCDPKSGCVFPFNAKPCDDQDACTSGDVCVLGKCLPGASTLSCNDSNPCTDDACDPKVGCTHVVNAKPCSDDDPCHTGDACAAGQCVPGTIPLDCGDANDCTNDECVAKQGCTHSTLPDATPCGSPGWTCKSGKCTAPQQTVKRVFVTSVGHNGNFGGIAGADAFCATRAAAASLPGTFKAWLSAAAVSTSPSVRFSKSSIPYALVDGTIVADNWADLTDGTIKVPIGKSEFGTPPSTGNLIWSFTRIDGTPGLFGDAGAKCYGADCHCNGWTTTNTGGNPTTGSAFGLRDKSNDDWTDYSFANACSGDYSLYCFEQ